MRKVFEYDQEQLRMFGGKVAVIEPLPSAEHAAFGAVAHVFVGVEAGQ